MKLRSNIGWLGVLTFGWLFVLTIVTPGKGKTPTKVNVAVVCAYDFRLPVLTNDGLDQVFSEAKRVLQMKLGDDTIFDFQVIGDAVPIEQVFSTVDYKDDPYFTYGEKYRYGLKSDPPFQRDKDVIIEFFKNWQLKDLAGFFPGKSVKAYDDVFDAFIPVYKEKVEKLKSIRLKDGLPLLDPEGKPSQSFVHWLGFMHAQDKYDVLVTNTLVFYDFYAQPYLHSVCKHAKAAGGGFQSPKRKTLDGMSMAMNILEVYGGIPEISYDNADVPRDLRNRALGGFIFAHEFAHAYYLIPDVYDHGDTCLMNSSFEKMSHIKGYKLLMSDHNVCKKCRPYIDAKREVLKAYEAMAANKFNKAGNLFLAAAEKTPHFIEGNHKEYLNKLYDRAMDCFSRTKDNIGLKKVGKLKEKLK